MPKEPPRFAERLLRLLLPGRDGEILAGDLREEFHQRGGGRSWYWRQALSCLRVRVSVHRRALPGAAHDFQHALRTIRRNPGYAATAMLCLALGIGVNTTVFSMIEEIYFRSLPVADPGALVLIDRGRQMACSYRDWETFSNRSKEVFTGLAALDTLPTSLDTEGVSEMIVAEAVTANYASVLGVRAALGRWFVNEDAQFNSEPVAVLSDHGWAARFSRSPSVLGKMVRIEESWYRVVGVAPPEFQGVSGPASAEAWIPLMAFPYYREQLRNPSERERPRVRMIGRLSPASTVERAQAILQAIDRQLEAQRPPRDSASVPLTVWAARGLTGYEGRRAAGPAAGLLLAVAAVVLLIACANVANLLLARSAVRSREMALRRALGASRWRLIRQTLAEGLALACGGALGGLLLGWWTSQLLAAAVPRISQAVRYGVELHINWRVALCTAIVALGSAILFSLSPALEQSRRQPGAALKLDGSGGGRGQRRRDAYVAAQVALSMAMLVAAALLVRALIHARQIDPGFAVQGRLSARLYVSEPEYTTQSARAFYQRVLDGLRQQSWVKAATLSYATPLNFTDYGCIALERDARPQRTSSNIVEPGYFTVMETPLLAGRDFSLSDAASAPRVVVVNQTLARRYWNGNALGKSLWLGCDDKTPRRQAEVIGIVRDSKYLSLGESPRPIVYSSLSQSGVGFLNLVVHTHSDPASHASRLRSYLLSHDRNLRIYDLRTMESVVESSLWELKLRASLLAGAGILALLLAAVGLYGLIAYAVAQRTREIGVRMALGAGAGDVAWMVLGRGLRLTSVGIAAGLALSAAVTRFLRGFLFGISPLDPSALLAASLLWIAIAMLASWWPARRATKVDPVIAFRWD